MSARASLALACLLSLAACDGPTEKAAPDGDQVPATAAGQNRPGAAQDPVERADSRASTAAADALERRGDQLRAEDGPEADRLDERARVMRKQADR